MRKVLRYQILLSSHCAQVVRISRSSWVTIFTPGSTMELSAHDVLCYLLDPDALGSTEMGFFKVTRTSKISTSCFLTKSQGSPYHNCKSEYSEMTSCHGTSMATRVSESRLSNFSLYMDLSRQFPTLQPLCANVLDHKPDSCEPIFLPPTRNV